MSSSSNYYRLTIRFTNGETDRFILCEPIDTGQLSEKSRFALVRTHGSKSDGDTHMFLASLADVSFIKTEPIEAKDLRQRVAGITGSLGIDGEDTPNEISTVEFI
jgi:hypothetical protein